MTILDTNTLIRFFTKDDPKKSKMVKRLLEKSNKLYIPEVVFPELEYVLHGHYKASRDKISQIFQFLVSKNNIKVEPVLEIASEIYSDSKLDMADCVVVAHATRSKHNKLASFDKELLEESKKRGVNTNP